MGIHTATTPGATAYAAIDLILATRRRDEIEIAVEALIAALDRRDGDPDLEDQCDDEGAIDIDCCPAADDHPRAGLSPASSPYSSIAHGVDIGDEDDVERGWTEWHTRGRHKVNQFGGESLRHGSEHDEDVEDDDPREDDDSDRCTANEDDASRFTGGQIGFDDAKAILDEDAEPDTDLEPDYSDVEQEGLVPAGSIVRMEDLRIVSRP